MVTDARKSLSHLLICMGVINPVYVSWETKRKQIYIQPSDAKQALHYTAAENL